MPPVVATGVPCTSTSSPFTSPDTARDDQVWTKCCASLDCAATEVPLMWSGRPSRWLKWQERCGCGMQREAFASGLCARRSCHCCRDPQFVKGKNTFPPTAQYSDPPNPRVSTLPALAYFSVLEPQVISPLTGRVVLPIL